MENNLLSLSQWRLIQTLNLVHAVVVTTEVIMTKRAQLNVSLFMLKKLVTTIMEFNMLTLVKWGPMQDKFLNTV